MRPCRSPAPGKPGPTPRPIGTSRWSGTKSSMVDRQEYANPHLPFGDWPPSAEKVLGIVAWGVAEGSEALWNPLDTTEPAAGATTNKRAGVQNYPSLQVGLEAVYA